MTFSLSQPKKEIRAFTLIEAIISIGLIMIAIIGPMSVAMHSSTYAMQTKDQVTAQYLAAEAVELLRFYRDSILIRCTDVSASCPAVDLGGGNYEQPHEAAWRLFKNNLRAGGVSCYAPSSCSYDLYGFMQNAANPALAAPTFWDSSDVSCSLLAVDDQKVRLGTAPRATDGIYLCKKNALTGFTVTKFSRKVQVTSVPGGSGNAYDKAYNDDLRVVVTVTYTKANGLVNTTKVTDFIRARI